MPGSRALTVAALFADASRDRAVGADLGFGVTVRHCRTSEALHALVSAHEIDALVVPALDRGGASVIPLITTAHEQDPGLRIVVDAPAEPAAFRQLPEAFWAGASEVAVRGYDRIGEVVRNVLALDWQPGAGLALLDTVPPMVPESLRAFAIACALKGSPRLTVEVVSDWVGTSARTVRSRLRRSSLSTPLGFIRYCSAAHAMCLLHPQRLHPNRVVERMRFGTRRALNDLLHRYNSDSEQGVPARWAYAALLLRAEEFLTIRHPRQPAKLAFIERLDRYMAGELSAEERLGFERWLAQDSRAARSALENMRSLWDNPSIGREVRQRREETWVRLLRSMRMARGP